MDRRAAMDEQGAAPRAHRPGPTTTTTRRRRTTPRWAQRASSLMVALIGAVAVLIVAACRTRGSPEGSPGPAPRSASAEPAEDLEVGGEASRSGRRLGERVEAGDFALTVESTKPCPKDFVKPGNTIIGVEVVVEGLVEREIQVNPFYGKLVTDDRRTYRPTLVGCEPRLNNVRLGQGDRTRGFINFEIPTRARRLELEYEPALTGTHRQTVVVALDR